MSNPSSYLEASLDRWTDRGALVRRERDMMLDGLETKGEFMESLRARVLRHRHEDLSQLKNAREESLSRWEERLRRMEEWSAAAAGLGHASGHLWSWKSGAGWFDRAQAILERYGAFLEKKGASLERQLFRLTEEIRQWSDSLILKETEVRGYSQLEAIRSTDLIIPSSKKRFFMDFVYAQREKEGALASDFKALRGAANLILERFARTENALTARADRSPGYFEIRKNNVLDVAKPLQKRFSQFRDSTLHQALIFEEGRMRLRWIYDTLQKMRVEDDAPTQKKPLLERLFKLEDQ